MNRVIGIVGAVASIVGLIAVTIKNVTDSRNKTRNDDEDFNAIDTSQRYGVKITNPYTNETDIMDEVFDNEEDAEYYALECGGNFAEGADVLDYANREYTEPSNVIIEVFQF